MGLREDRLYGKIEQHLVFLVLWGIVDELLEGSEDGVSLDQIDEVLLIRLFLLLLLDN